MVLSLLCCQADALGESALFSPHYAIIDGRAFGCVRAGVSGFRVAPRRLASQLPVHGTDWLAGRSVGTVGKCLRWLPSWSGRSQADGKLPCGRQCTHGGRYCAEDPEHNFRAGRDGEDVVHENLRQICIWQVVNETAATIEDGRARRRELRKWWEYVVRFNASCAGADGTFDAQCSVEQQKESTASVLSQKAP